MITIPLTFRALQTAIAITIVFIIVSVLISYAIFLKDPYTPDWILTMCILVISLAYYCYMYLILQRILLQLFDNRSFKFPFIINLGIIILSLLAFLLKNEEAIFYTGLLLLITGFVIFIKFIAIYKSDNIFLIYGFLGITSMSLSVYLSLSGFLFISTIVPYAVNLGTILILLRTMSILRHGKNWNVDLIE